MVVDIQDGRKPQDTLTIKRQKTLWFKSPRRHKTRQWSLEVHRTHAFPLAFTNYFLIEQGRWSDERLSGGCQHGNISRVSLVPFVFIIF